AIVRSRQARQAWRYLGRPAIFGVLALVLARLLHIADATALAVGAAGFVLAAVAANSRIGVRVEEILADAAVRAGRHIGKGILPGLFRLVLDFFKLLVELIDRAIYAVDEALRFRRGDPRVALALKAVFGTLWSAIAYVIRIYVNLLIEPTVNPIKHFPVVTV